MEYLDGVLLLYIVKFVMEIMFVDYFVYDVYCFLFVIM